MGLSNSVAKSRLSALCFGIVLLLFPVVTDCPASELPDGGLVMAQAEAAIARHPSLELTLDREIEMRFLQKARLRDHLSITSGASGKLRLERRWASGGTVVVSDGIATHAYGLPSTGYYRNIPAVMNLTLALAGFGAPLLPGTAFVPTTARTVGTDTLSLQGKRRECWVVEGTQLPNSGGEITNTLETFWIDKSTYMVLRAKVAGRYRGWYQYKINASVRSLNVGVPLPEVTFRFVPPAESQPVDIPTAEGDSAILLDSRIAGQVDLTKLVEPPGQLAPPVGQHVLLAFAPLWCQPCRESMPWMERLYQQFRGRGFVVIQYGGSEESQNAAVPAVTYPVIRHPAPDVGFLISGYPTFVMIKKDGTIVGSHTGFDTAAHLSLIRTLVESALNPSRPRIGKKTKKEN